MRVFMVEDNALVADAIRSGLAARGFAVDHLASAHVARSARGHEDFDLIVIGRGLLVAHGFPLMQRLRAESLTLPALIRRAHDARTDHVHGLGYRPEETEK